MGWVVLIVIVFLVIAAMGAGSKAKQISKIKAVFGMLHSETAFRQYYRWTYKQLMRSELDPFNEERMVGRYYGRHSEMVQFALTVDEHNHEIIRQTLLKQGDALDAEIYDFLGAGSQWRQLGDAGQTKLGQRYASEQLGLST